MTRTSLVNFWSLIWQTQSSSTSLLGAHWLQKKTQQLNLCSRYFLRSSHTEEMFKYTSSHLILKGGQGGGKAADSWGDEISILLAVGIFSSYDGGERVSSEQVGRTGRFLLQVILHWTSFNAMKGQWKGSKFQMHHSFLTGTTVSDSGTPCIVMLRGLSSLPIRLTR